MKKLALLLALLLLCSCAMAACGSQKSYRVGVGTVNVTPEGLATIVGNTAPLPVSTVDFDLYVKAVVISAGKEQVAIVTLDSLKYPTSLAEEAMAKVEKETGIPADRITITSSHTHSGPHYSSYEDMLEDSIVEAVKLAKKDMEPCRLAVTSTNVDGVSHNRRLIDDGEAWNDWMITMRQAWYYYEAAGACDTELIAVAAIDKNDNYKAILWNFACHANSNIASSISADYPAKVQEFIRSELDSQVEMFYLTGPSGDVNPNNSTESVGNRIGELLLESLNELEPIDEVSLKMETNVIDIPAREDPVFAEEEIAEKWPDQLESYRNSFDATMKLRKESYPCYVCGISFGSTAAIITDPGELFSQFALNIKEASPFKYTLVTEQTNGALGYMPTERDFELHGYESWYGEHSLTSVHAGAMIEEESVSVLNGLYGGN